MTEQERMLAGQLYDAGNPELAADMDLHFHIMLVEFARSPKIAEHAKTILVQTRRLSQLSVYDTSRTLEFIQEHRNIYEALDSRDSAAAEEAVSRHIASILRFQADKLGSFL